MENTTTTFNFEKTKFAEFKNKLNSQIEEIESSISASSPAIEDEVIEEEKLETPETTE